MKQIMIDIETLDTKTSAVVLSVGWCMFDHDRIGDPAEMVLDMQEQIDKFRTISAKTLTWWMEQSEEARRRVFFPEKVHSISDVATRLRMILHGGDVEHVWAHGPHFDIATLKDMLGAEPWHFRSIRDTRTLATLAPEVERCRSIVEHSAGDDAHAQAQWVQNMLKHLGRTI